MVSRVLGGSCEVPLAAYATWHDGALHLRGIVATPDGHRVLERAGVGTRADHAKRAMALGRDVASAISNSKARWTSCARSSTASAVDGAAASSGNGAADSAVSGD